MLKALIIQDDKGKFKDLEDVVKIARTEGQRAFRTEERVFVRRIWQDHELSCYVVVVEGPSVQKPKGVCECKP
jgi:hypothetical protein